MRNFVCVLGFIVSLPGLAIGAENPDWAYPPTPKPAPLDNVVQKQMPGSAKKYTQAQIDDGFNPPDWFPDEHPPMPEVVATGRKPARACALCHLPTGDGHPESSSLAEGKALVRSGGSGQTIPCAICHGPSLKGRGELPGIAGRPPIYVVRQLNDMQNGNRTGSLAELMKAVVAKLSIEDMVAIAAYLGSLEP